MSQRMTSPSRDEFLSHVHPPRTHRNADPPPGSPTKSTMRYRWRELRPWAVKEEAQVYWDGLSNGDKTQKIDASPEFWNVAEQMLRALSQPLTSEPTLKVPFAIAFQTPHNTAIQGLGAEDPHAEIWSEGSQLA